MPKFTIVNIYAEEGKAGKGHTDNSIQTKIHIKRQLKLGHNAT